MRPSLPRRDGARWLDIAPDPTTADAPWPSHGTAPDGDVGQPATATYRCSNYAVAY